MSVGKYGMYKYINFKTLVINGSMAIYIEWEIIVSISCILLLMISNYLEWVDNYF